MIISISDRTITIGEFYIMKKPKLTIEEQIEDMKSKNITFQYVSEKEAADFLRHNNYYFKLKSYGKNYEKYRIPAKAGQYVNLDFSYLQELSTLDMHLRKLILSMALDIEHALKTKILFDLSNNADEDGDIRLSRNIWIQIIQDGKICMIKLAILPPATLSGNERKRMTAMPCGKLSKYCLLENLLIYTSYIIPFTNLQKITAVSSGLSNFCGMRLHITTAC